MDDDDGDERVRNCSMCEGQYLHDYCDHFGSMIAPSPAQTSTVPPDTGAAASGVMGPVVTPDFAVRERGPWRVHVYKGLAIGVESADFHHDALLRVSGDFADGSKRLEYCDLIASLLNEAIAARSALAGTPGAAATPQGETCASCGGIVRRSIGDSVLFCCPKAASGRSPTRDKK